MALHDAEVQDITAMDPCHKFAWCLDACIREQFIDPKRSRELQGFLEGVKRGQEQVIGDLSVTLCDPYAINFLATSTFKILNHIINNETLARDNQALVLILRMLNLGLHAWDILNSHVYREPKLDSELFTKFLPILMSLMVDDQVRNVNSKLPPDDRESALTIIEHSGPPPDLYQKFIVEDRLAAMLSLYYTFQVIKQKDRTAIVRVLGYLSSSNENRALEDPYLHTLVSLLIQMPEEFANEDLCTVVFDEIFLTSLDQGSTPHHLIRLIHQVYSHLPSHRLTLLLNTLRSCKFNNEAVVIAFKSLEQKMEEFYSDVDKKVDISVNDEMNFPISVPTPLA